MKISNERETTIIFLVLGILGGIIANFLNSLLVAFPIVALIYAGGLFLVYRIFKEKNIQPLVASSIITYIFLLIIVWTVLFTVR